MTGLLLRLAAWVGALAATAAHGAEPPLGPSPEEGRRLAQDELARPEYHEPRSVLQQVLSWVHGLRQDANPQTRTSQGVHIPRAVAVLVLVLACAAVVAFIVYLILRVRREPAHRGKSLLGDDEELLPPEQYRARAAAALARGDADAALLDAFRALTSRSFERTLLDDVPSLTAREVGRALVPVFPAHADAVTALAGRFDQVLYGSRHAHAAEARAALDLEAQVSRTRPRLAAGDGPGPDTELVAPGASSVEDTGPEDAR